MVKRRAPPDKPIPLAPRAHVKQAVRLSFAEAMRRADLAQTQGQYPLAEQLYRTMLAESGEDAEVLHRLGALYHRLGNHQEAEPLMRRALALKPGAADIRCNLGVVLLALHEPSEALEQFEAALAALPNHAAIHYNRGNALLELNRLVEALAAYDRAIEFQPLYADAHDNRGVVLEKLKKPEEALLAHERALQLQPGFAKAHYNHGSVLLEVKRFAEALVSFDQALALSPNFPEAHCRRGYALAKLNRHGEALPALDRALALRPDYPEAISIRAAALMALDRSEEGLADVEAALSAHPKFARLHDIRGCLLLTMGRYREGLDSCLRALQLDPQAPEIRWNLALAQLYLGDFENGFANYEWRWHHLAMASPRQFDCPLWLGSGDISGKTILLHPEQGLGDIIQFSRYVERVAERGARVLLEVPESLLELMTSLNGVAELVVQGQTLPAFDVHCPLASLPFAMATRLESIPAPIPYLHPTAERVAEWRTRLPHGRPLIGIAVSGNPAHSNDRNRSLPLAALLPLLELDVQWVFLQKEIRPEDEPFLESHPEILAVSDQLRDFGETAALVSLLDLVISVDTSIAHLAGALGRPLWLLLPHHADWRWLLDREDSPWYPTARLLRQSRARDWSGVVARAKTLLTAALATADAPDFPPPPPTLPVDRQAAATTDIARWSNQASLLSSWDSRAEFAAQFIAAGSTVLDLGCGKMALEQFLPEGCRYIPADLVSRDVRTVICDLNAGDYPEAAAASAQVITLLGVIEYVVDLRTALQWLLARGCPVIITYHPADATAGMDRLELGWLNHLTLREWRRLLENVGFQIEHCERLSNIQYLFRLLPAAAQPLPPMRVAVLSYANIGNFGDRLGVHLLHSVLPPNCQVRHYYHEPWIGPDPDEFDLLVLGIGNSIFAPLLTDELLRLVEASPKTIGIFGTQFRSKIDRDRMRALLGRLDCWFARYEEDVLLFGDMCAHTEHLGDWLIEAFPMAEASEDEPLMVGSEIWQELPLDRWIQKIQRHRTVVSTRLHPLLGALTSAQWVEYSEQWLPDGSLASGKFRSMLYDVFHRGYPENSRWAVDRAKVRLYKDHVSRKIDTLRAYLRQLAGWPG